MDIVERLRAREHFDTWNNEFVSKEAADEIERLREELNDLRLSYEVVVAALREKE